MATHSAQEPSDVLVTGGSEGIGRGLAALYVASGGNVLVTGRNADKLDLAARELPGLRTYVNDISNPAQRRKHGVPLDDFCRHVFAELQRADSDTIGYGPTDTPEFKQLVGANAPYFEGSSMRYPVAVYSSGGSEGSHEPR